ncbi:hypothetical protein C6P77_14495 [Burkholderia ambifaria]|nr:hypothetical protein C6P77_14495 [Burkholderia ambifaria]
MYRSRRRTDAPTYRRSDAPTYRRSDAPTYRRSDVPTLRRADHAGAPTRRPRAPFDPSPPYSSGHAVTCVPRSTQSRS